MKLRLFILSVLICVGVSASAQESVITVSKDSRLSKEEQLGGKGAVVFMSKSEDLVISTTVNKDPICEAPQKIGEVYAYKMVLEITGNRSRVFNISKKGTTFTHKTSQVLLSANKCIGFNVEIVDNPITMETSDAGAEGYIHHGSGWALIEVNSEVKLQWTYSNKLRAHLKDGYSKSGTYVDSLIINVSDLHQKRDLMNAKHETIEKMQNQCDSLVDHQASDAEIDALEEKIEIAKAEAEELSAELNELTYISIKGEGTNERTIDSETILSLSSKGKIAYKVMVLLKTVSVFKTKYEEMLNQAVSHKNSRDYASAKMYYENAANAEGATEDDKQAALQSALQMENLAKFKAETDAIADKLYDISAKNQIVNKNVFIKMLDDMVERYRALFNETGDKYYNEEAERLLKEKNNVGFVFKGKLVLSEYKGGSLQETPLTNVRIYGSDYSNCAEMDKKDYLHKGIWITTVTASDGTYSLTLKPGEFKTLIFEAEDSKIKKNKHVSIEGRTDDRNVKIRFTKN